MKKMSVSGMMLSEFTVVCDVRKKAFSEAGKEIYKSIREINDSRPFYISPEFVHCPFSLPPRGRLKASEILNDLKPVMDLSEGSSQYLNALYSCLNKEDNFDPDLLIIDTPEIGLDSYLQVNFVPFLTMAVNRGLPVLLISRSPYILSVLDNILEASRLYKKGDDSAEYAEEIFDKRSMVNINKFAFYVLRKGKQPVDIMDRESGRVDIPLDEIDFAADFIAHQMDEILAASAIFSAD